MPYTEQELGNALIKADKAGDTAAARQLTQEIMSLRQAGSAQPAPVPPPKPETATQKRADMSMFSPSAQHGLTAGFSDKLAGAARAVMPLITGDWSNIPEAYESGRAEEEGRRERFAALNPKRATAEEMLGSLVAFGGTGPKPTLQAFGPYKRAAIEGAGVGGITGTGYAPSGSEGTGALTGAAAGAVLAPVLRAGAEVVGKGVGRVVGGKQTPAPTIEALKADSGKLYQQADDVGFVVTKDAVTGAADDIERTMKTEGFHPRMHTDIAVALDEIKSAGAGDVTLTQWENLRRLALEAGNSGKPSERRLSGILIDKIDDALDGFKATDVTSGDPKAAGAILDEARGLWRRAKKAEVIQKIFDDAEIDTGQYSVSGKENAYRKGFSSLAKNDKKMRQFNKEETKAIRDAAMGGPISKILRGIGKLAVRGPVSGIPAGGALYAGEPVIAGTLAALGEAGKAGATRARLTNARIADELVRRGMSPTVSPVRQKTAEGTYRAVLGASPPPVEDQLARLLAGGQ
jgi:hypothetical protein